MTERPNGGADTAVGPVPGYYPDPSIPGFVRYWGGSAWVPGTTRPAPADGEVLEAPRIVSRYGRGGGGPGAGAGVGVAPVVVPPPAGVRQPGAGRADGPADGSAGGPGGAAAGPGGVAEVSDTRTGPVYLDETSAGASFVMAPRSEMELRPRGDVEQLRPQNAGLRPVPPTAAARAVEGPPVEGSGWQADPQAQRGLLETGSAPRWVSWGVLPASGAESEDGLAHLDHRAAPPSFPAPAPVRSVRSERPGDPGVGGGAGAEAGVVEARVDEVPASASAVAGADSGSGSRPAEAGPEVVPVPVAAPVPVSPVGDGVPGPRTTETSGPASAPAAPAGAGDASSGVAAPGPVDGVDGPGAPEGAGAGVAVAVGAGVGRARSAGSGKAVPTSAAADASVAEPAPERAARRRPAGGRPAPLPPAGPVRRLAARVFDASVTAVVAVAAGVPLGTSAVAHVREKVEQARMASAIAGHEVQVWLVDGVVAGKAVALVGVLVLLGLLYEVLPTARTGQTLGKRLVRIRVVDARGSDGARRRRLPFGRSLLRWALGQVSMLVPIGLLWPLLDRRSRRGWHDRAAGTRVVRG